MADEENSGVFGPWLDRINAKARVKAICKPCWEIKYCPYGPLVEQFPLAEGGDPQRCIIFGHICPVFRVAEPFTETKELRNINRDIPRPVQFRVLKRDNQVCRMCGKHVREEDIHFDHIIPWSKGGSSDENNVQLLCDECNLKKSANFEKEHLVDAFTDHVCEAVDDDILGFLFLIVHFGLDFRSDEGRFPSADNFAECLNEGEKTIAEQRGAQILSEIDEFFRGKRPKELSAKVFKALRFRWGFDDGDTYYLKSVADEYDIDVDDLLNAEVALVGRLGWRVALNKSATKRWLRT